MHWYNCGRLQIQRRVWSAVVSEGVEVNGQQIMKPPNFSDNLIYMLTYKEQPLKLVQVNYESSFVSLNCTITNNISIIRLK